MPSDHGSISARHRARTHSRAKSLRKHIRWLVQHQEKLKSVPNLHATRSIKEASQGRITKCVEQKKARDDKLKRTVSLRSRRPSDAMSFQVGESASCCSTSASTNTKTQFGPNTNHNPSPYLGHNETITSTTTPFPFREVSYTANRRKVGITPSTSAGSAFSQILTPYPATTTTRTVSIVTSNSIVRFTPGELPAKIRLQQVERRYNADQILATGVKGSHTEVRASGPTARAKIFTKTFIKADIQTPSSDSSNTTVSTSSTSSTTTTSIPQISDSDALRHLYARPASLNLTATAMSSQLKSPPRAKTFSHLPKQQSRGFWGFGTNLHEGDGEGEGERARLLISSNATTKQETLEEKQSETQTRPQNQRQNQNQKHQRWRHPQLIYPYAPGSTPQLSPPPPPLAGPKSGCTTGPSQYRSRTLKVRRFVDGYWLYVSVPSEIPGGDARGHREGMNGVSTARHESRSLAKTQQSYNSLNHASLTRGTHLSTPQGSDNNSANSQQTIWSRARSSFLAGEVSKTMKKVQVSVSGVGVGVGAVSLGFWPAGPRRMV